MRLLLVEDDAMLGDSLRQALANEGYRVDWVRDGEAALAAAAAAQFALILLDLNLPAVPGLDVLKNLRDRRVTTPILIVTASDRPRQRVEGLDAGADDYLVKPFDLDELIARVRAHIRRQDRRTTNKVQAQDVEIDLTARLASRNGLALDLTAKEYRVLSLLVRRAGHFVSKAEIEADIYDFDGAFESNTIEVTIYALRQKLGQTFVTTGRGLGYKVKP